MPSQSVVSSQSIAARPPHASRDSVIEVRAKDLPWHCPPPGAALWDQHPRVFIQVEAGERACPYCGARYRLAEGEHAPQH